MDTERVRFCTGPEVNFDFFLHSTTTGASSMVAPPLSFAGIPWKIPHFNGQKVGINNKRGNRVTKNKTRFWPDQKKANPMTRFASNFCAAPRGDPIICNRGTALVATRDFANAKSLNQGEIANRAPQFAALHGRTEKNWTGISISWGRKVRGRTAGTVKKSIPFRPPKKREKNGKIWGRIDWHSSFLHWPWRRFLFLNRQLASTLPVKKRVDLIYRKFCRRPDKKVRGARVFTI